MKTNRDAIIQYLAEHPGVSLRDASKTLGVHYSTVSRARATMPSATPLQTDTQHVAELADGFYQAQDGKPYRIHARPGDEFHVDDGQVVPGRKPRSVAVRAE